jgi:hypothetical protein
LCRCAIAHTSTIFSNDSAAGDWTLLANLTLLPGTVVAGANITLTGNTLSPRAIYAAQKRAPGMTPGPRYARNRPAL